MASTDFAEREGEGGGGKFYSFRPFPSLKGCKWMRLIELYFSTVKILAQRPTHMSAVATVLLITKTFIVEYYDRRI